MPTSRKRAIILGLGSLLSERSARSTFPQLESFRLGRVEGFRRVFAHSPSIFVERGIADQSSLEMASLSAEPDETAGFVCAVFSVPDEGWDAFVEREEEFELRTVPFADLIGEGGGTGILCTRSTDAAYVERWGRDRWEEKYARLGLSTIWEWGTDSGLRPCAPYLRHCVLAAEKLGAACLDSFLDETWLADRKTTVRQYLQEHPEVMATPPPPELAERYGG